MSPSHHAQNVGTHAIRGALLSIEAPCGSQCHLCHSSILLHELKVLGYREG